MPIVHRINYGYLYKLSWQLISESGPTYGLTNSIAIHNVNTDLLLVL